MAPLNPLYIIFRTVENLHPAGEDHIPGFPRRRVFSYAR
jgi:hypothetical protein